MFHPTVSAEHRQGERDRIDMQERSADRAKAKAAATKAHFAGHHEQLKKIEEKSTALHGAIIEISERRINALYERNELRGIIESAEANHNKVDPLLQERFDNAEAEFARLDEEYQKRCGRWKEASALASRCREWLAGAELEFSDSWGSDYE